MAQSQVSPQQTGLRNQTANTQIQQHWFQQMGITHHPQAAGNQHHNPNIPINLQPNVNVKVDGTGLDTFVPVIPEVQTEDIKELFKVKYLTKLDG